MFVRLIWEDWSFLFIVAIWYCLINFDTLIANVGSYESCADAYSF